MNKKQRILTPVTDCPAEIGLMLALLIDARQRTLRSINDISEDAIDWQSSHHRHTIGTLLYHIAAIEIDWFVTEVMEGNVDEEIWDWFPYEVRDDGGLLTIVKDESLERHLERFKTVRDLLINGYKELPLEEFRRKRELEAYDVTPRWILHHLCQHEAEHRDEINALRQKFEAAQSD